MPTTRPEVSTSGPPELPGLIGASVWMYQGTSSAASCRATVLTTPMVTVLPRPSGEPNASTSCPWRSPFESPSSSGLRPCAGTLISARSVSVSMPITCAVSLAPSATGSAGPPASLVTAAGISTWMRVARSTTCALVTISPSASRMIPEAVT